jgi:lipopolysaccharide export LptBFGC system permease protein LptF
MRIIEGYVARQIARVTVLVLVIVSFALLLERTLRLMHEMDPATLPLPLAAGLLAARLPEIVGIALPPAFFAGMLLTFQRLVRDRELDAAYAAGTGPGELVRPLLAATLAVVALLMLVFWYLLPLSHFTVRDLTDQAARAAIGAPLKPGSFVQLKDGVLYIQPRTAGGMANIFVYEPAMLGDRYVTTATVEDFELSKDRGTLFFAARNGQRLTIPGPERQSGLLTFAHVRQLIYAVPPGNAAPRGARADELTLGELIAKPAADRDRDPGLRSQLHIKFARVIVALFLPLAALPLGLMFSVRRQWIAIAVGVLLMLSVDQALIFGEALASRGEMSPWLGIWGVTAAFAALAGTLAMIQGFRFSRGRAEAV